MVADGLVHHPAFAHYQRLAATTVGRDKLLRVVQYFARFYAWYLFRTNGTPGEVAPWESLKAKLGLVRKVLRAGKGADHLKEAALLADDPKLVDPVLKYAAVGRQLGYAGYLTLDLLTLPAAVGFWPATDRTKRIQRQAYQFWAYGIACSIVAGAYKLYRLREREARVDKKEGDGAVESKRIAIEKNASHLQLVSDLCDLTIPTSALAWANFDDGFVGLAGTVSSLIGLMAQWQKTAK